MSAPPPPPPVANALDRSRAVRRVLGGLLIANIAVVLAKATIGMLAGSLAVLGDAVHSSVDAVYNVLGLVVVRVASREPDEEHPYGHGKFETLGALAIVVFLSITCFELVRSAIGRLVSGGHTVRMSDAGLALLLATLATNILVAWYENRRGHELASELLIADAAHTRTDVFITIGVLIGVLFSRQGEGGGHTWVDPVVAIAVALLIVRVAYQILKRVVPVLVDERAIPEPTIRQSAQAVAGVKSAYGIRSRGGNTGVRYAEVTIAVDSSANVAAAHAIADAVEERLKKDLELEEVTVHVEPC
ncbi:MAG TPA: cation diffusion facilitator family transporter [Gemmatimonadales bacterium]|nr:cation diffusion facilitator family transporter [Gemmatimonadales bacterium]